MNTQNFSAAKKRQFLIFIFAISLIILVLSLFSTAKPYINDDAVISYRYAWRLVNGEGLVTWPGGPREEGFSNPLLVILSAIGAKAFGAQSLEAVIRAGFAWNYLAVIALLSLLCCNPAPQNNPVANWLSSVLLAASYPLSWYVHSGLETPLYTFFLTATLLTIMADRPKLTIMASIGLATTRTEGLFLALIAWGAYFFQTWAESAPKYTSDLGIQKQADNQQNEKQELQILLKSFAVFVGIYFLFTLARFLYFGHIFSNPVFIKSPLHKDGKTVFNGIRYLLVSIKYNPFFTFVFVTSLVEMLRPKKIMRYLPILAVVLAQICFVLAVGGDEIHLGTFRFLLPIFPLMIWVAMIPVSRILSPGKAIWAALFLLLSTMPHYNAILGSWDIYRSDFYKRLTNDPKKTLTTQWNRWTTQLIWVDAEVGRFLARLTADQGRGLSIACVQAGSFPVYWQGEFIDLIGLTTRQIALAKDNKAKNEVFKTHPADIVVAFRWMGGWFPVPTAQTMLELGYKPFMLIQLKETQENGHRQSDFTLNFLVLARDFRIFKNLALETFDGMVSVSFDDETGTIGNEVPLKVISINL